MRKIIYDTIKVPIRQPITHVLIPKDTYNKIRNKLHKIAAGRNTFGQNVQDAQDVLAMLTNLERASV